jgi:hypothetical protein
MVEIERAKKGGRDTEFNLGISAVRLVSIKNKSNHRNAVLNCGKIYKHWADSKRHFRGSAREYLNFHAGKQ